MFDQRLIQFIICINFSQLLVVLIDFLQEAFELNKPPRSKKCIASSISQLETGKDAVMSMSVGAVKHGERHQKFSNLHLLLLFSIIQILF